MVLLVLQLILEEHQMFWNNGRDLKFMFAIAFHKKFLYSDKWGWDIQNVLSSLTFK